MRVKFVRMALAAIVICATMSSCGISNEATNTKSELQTQVVLSQKNYRVVREVYGESKQIYICGIGGLSAKSMRSCAVSDMMSNANLTGSEAIVNVSVQFKSATVLPFWMKKKAIARGTVIEFIDPTSPENNSEMPAHPSDSWHQQ